MTDYLYCTNENQELCLAVIKNKINDVQYWLERGADPNYRDVKNITPLCWAAMNPRGGEIFRLLLRYGAKPSVADIDGRTPLHYAAMHGSQKIISILLNIKKTNLNALDKTKHSPLYYAAQEGHLAVVEQLLQHGAYANVTSHNVFKTILDRWLLREKITSTPLIASVENRHPEVTYALIKAGANVNETDESNNTALHHAVIVENTETIPMLINADADISRKNKEGHTPKEIVCIKDKKIVFAYLSSNMQNRLGWYTQPLHDAALWITILNGEERAILFILSQMSHAKRKERLSTHYPVDLSFSILRYMNDLQLSSYRYLPTEIWQRISAFWIKDLLSLDVDIEQIDYTMGYVFSNMDDFFTPNHNVSVSHFKY